MAIARGRRTTSRWMRSRRGWSTSAARCAPNVTSRTARDQYQLWNAHRNTQTSNQIIFPRPSAGRRTVSSLPCGVASSRIPPASTTKRLMRQGCATAARSRRYAQLSANHLSIPFSPPARAAARLDRLERRHHGFLLGLQGRVGGLLRRDFSFDLARKEGHLQRLALVGDLLLHLGRGDIADEACVGDHLEGLLLVFEGLVEADPDLGRLAGEHGRRRVAHVLDGAVDVEAHGPPSLLAVLFGVLVARVELLRGLRVGRRGEQAHEPVAVEPRDAAGIAIPLLMGLLVLDPEIEDGLRDRGRFLVERARPVAHVERAQVRLDLDVLLGVLRVVAVLLRRFEQGAVEVIHLLRDLEYFFVGGRLVFGHQLYRAGAQYQGQPCKQEREPGRREAWNESELAKCLHDTSLNRPESRSSCLRSREKCCTQVRTAG